MGFRLCILTMSRTFLNVQSYLRSVSRNSPATKARMAETAMSAVKGGGSVHAGAEPEVYVLSPIFTGRAANPSLHPNRASVTLQA